MANQFAASLKGPMKRFRIVWQGLAGCAGIGILTLGGTALGLKVSTISFLYLMLVVTVALLYGFWQASAVSLLAVACLDYFFSPPLYSFRITSSQDYVVMIGFELTALVISRLSAKEIRSARDATIHRTGMEQLYELSRSSLLVDMRQPPGPQLVRLIERIFNARAVALYDAILSRVDTCGVWEEGEEELAKRCYFRDSSLENPGTQTSERVLRVGTGSVGALVLRGDLSPRVVDALTSLAAIAMDRHQSFEKEERAESAKQGEQLRTAVLDALAHDLKTPLTAVQTASSGLLQLGKLDASQRQLVQLIDHEAIRLNDLCTRLLQTAKLQTEEVGLKKDEVNVSQLISEVVAKRTGEGAPGIIDVSVDDPTLSVRVDRALLAMILAQYVDNACKYSKPGTKIEVAARKSHSEVVFSVHNFGAPVRIEDREKIFERFYRSPDSKDTVAGTGIGLSIVRKAAEAHHGHVWVISDEKEGTTFFLSLPEQARRKH